jgi:hypothetical protein
MLNSLHSIRSSKHRFASHKKKKRFEIFEEDDQDDQGDQVLLFNNILIFSSFLIMISLFCHDQASDSGAVAEPPIVIKEKK